MPSLPYGRFLFVPSFCKCKNTNTTSKWLELEIRLTNLEYGKEIVRIKRWKIKWGGERKLWMKQDN